MAWDHWESNSAQRAGYPHLQPRVGPAQVAEFFAAFAQTCVVHAFEVRGIVADDVMAVADVLIEAEYASGGRLRDEELHRWTFGPDGRVTSLRHYVDTAKHIAAVLHGEDTTAQT